MRLSDGDDDLDLYWYAAGQRTHADGRTRVPAALAKHLDKEVGAAIDDFRMIFEIGNGIDHAEYLDDILNAVELAAKRIPDRRDQDQTHAAGMLIPFLDRYAGAELAFGHPAIRPFRRTLAGEIEEIADPFGVDIVSDRTAYRMQYDPQLSQPLLDAHLVISGKSRRIILEQ